MTMAWLPRAWLPPPARRVLRQAVPDLYSLNRRLALPHFIAGHGRAPRPVEAEDATISDYIFERMLRGRWSRLERRCVDKALAKPIAAALAGVRSAQVLAVRPRSAGWSLDAVEAWLAPFIGRRLVLKPTHSSGQVLFLDQPLGPGQLAEFLGFCRRSLFHKCRETQYRGLAQKLIIEANLFAPGETPVDYKFFCARGEVICCDLNIDRFADRTCALCGVPGFEVLSVGYVGDKPARDVEKPETLPQMLEAARRLSQPFDFVRIDLYSVRGAVYFGEFTFTPCAGCAAFTSEAWAIEVLAKVKRNAAAARDC